MPPKAARGAARGRGRGRGKATAAEDSAPVAESEQPTTSASASTDAPKPTNTVPQYNDDDFERSPSSNSSPVTIPTETPASTPARPGLAPSEPSEINAPPPYPTRGGRGGGGAGVARGGVRGGAAPAPAPSRFKPKNIRRDASELEEIGRKEIDRLAAIAAENAREASRQARGRGRPPRGRGDAMGRGGFGKRSTAMGTFGIAPESLKTATGGMSTFREGGGGGGGYSGGSGSGVKREGGPGGSYSGGGGGGGGGGGSRGADGREWVPEPQYPDEDVDIAKVDIEQINLVSDEEPEYLGTRKVDKKQKGLRPIRLLREDHKERTVVVNADIKVQPESDDEMPEVDEFRSSKGAEQANMYSGVKIKDEPRTTPEPEEVPGVKSSPDSRRKAQDSLASIVPMSIDSTPIPDSPKKIKRPAKKTKKPEVVHQTDEDREEYHRHLEDVDILSKELVALQSNGGNDSGKGKDVEGDVSMDGLANATIDQDKDENGRLYLFQFPPVLPELYNPKDPKPKNPILVKREEEEAARAAKEELEFLGALTAKAKNKLKEQPDLKDLKGEAAPPIKKEEEGVETPTEKLKREEAEAMKKGKPEVIREEGFVGKLIVRKSGKVELIWGGTTLLVGRGAEASFLTTGVIVDSVERGPQGGGAPEGKAVGMGQIMGKFVVTPDWENY